MAKIKKQKYDFDEVLQNDELEERESIANESKRKKKVRRKRRRKLVLLLIVSVAVFYLISDYSNVNVVEMNGNEYYSKQQIMKIAGISYDSKSVFAPSFLIRNRLEDDELIKEASVSKSWDGVVSIQLEEEKLLGYYMDKDDYYLLVDSEDAILMKDKDKLANVPYLNGLNKQQIAGFKKYIKDVKKENILLISEVLHYETSYDKNMLKLVMQDGHIVYTTYKGLPLMDSYTEMLKGLNTDLKCVVFAEETNTMYTTKCE